MADNTELEKNISDIFKKYLNSLDSEYQETGISRQYKIALNKLIKDNTDIFIKVLLNNSFQTWQEK